MMLQQMLEKLGIGRSLSALAIAIGALGSWPLQSQISRKGVWDIHDAFILGSKPLQNNDDPALVVKSGTQQVFTGKSGKKVLGWDNGPKDGSVILWWSGGPGVGFAPGPSEDRFSASAINYRQVCIDTPGCGNVSEWVPNWRPEDSVEDAVTFLKLRGIKGPVIVSGWSWGSTMSLLFAQRHPELVKGVVVGGVWANTAAEVKRYIGPKGTKTLTPGTNQVFAPIFGKGNDPAGRLHRAIRDGKGGSDLVSAYGMSEGFQGLTDVDMREPFSASAWKKYEQYATPESNDMAKQFAFIESEMMWRGERGKWKLRLEFPRSLANTPLIVIQGRYDQICDPAIAIKAYDAWPGSNKLLILMNANHGGYLWVNEDSLKRAGAPHDPESLLRAQRAMRLHLGDPQTMNLAGIEFIARNENH
jgi:proline iminopeptidase